MMLYKTRYNSIVPKGTIGKVTDVLDIKILAFQLEFPGGNRAWFLERDLIKQRDEWEDVKEVEKKLESVLSEMLDACVNMNNAKYESSLEKYEVARAEYKKLAKKLEATKLG